MNRQEVTSAADQQLIQAINDLNTAFAHNDFSDSQQEHFFRLAELPRKRLPQGSSQVTAGNFLAVVISIISAKLNMNYSARAIKVLHTYLRYDQAVFQVLRPNKPLLIKMGLEEHIESTNPTEVENALELTYFLLRYHRSVDFGDFSDKLHVTQRIRRYHDYKIWYEIEELTGRSDDQDGNFNAFKDVTQKALTEIMAHLGRLSDESEQRIKSETGLLSQKFQNDISKLNAILAEQKALREGLESENYKKLLDLLMQLDNKIKQTYQSVISDLRQEFVGLINASESKHENLTREQQERLQKQISDLKESQIGPADLQNLKRELEQIVKDRGIRSENNYQKLLELLSDLEGKQDQKFSAYISDFKNQIPELLEAQRGQLDTQMNQNQQKVLDLLTQLEQKVDKRDAEVIREASSEVEKLATNSQRALDASVERLMNLMQQLGERTDSKAGSLTEEINNVQRETQKLINERSRQLEQTQQVNYQKLIEMMVDLEAKLEKHIAGQISDQQNRIDRINEEQKQHFSREINKNYMTVTENMVELEKRMVLSQGEIVQQFKREFQAVMDEKIARQEGLTNENYRKTLALLMELEKRLDDRQKDLLTELRNDFAKIVSQLNIPLMRQELEDSFGRKIKNVEQALADQERSLMNTFDTLIRQADTQINKQVGEAIKSANEEAAQQVDEKIANTVNQVKRGIDTEVKKTKDSLTVQIQQAIELQQRTLQGTIKNTLDENKNDFERQVERVINEINAKTTETIDKRLEDSQASISRIIDSKLLASQRELQEDVGAKMRDSAAGLWNKTMAQINDLDDQVKRAFDIKLEQSVQDLLNQMNNKVRDNNQSLQLTFNEINEETKRNINAQIQRALAGLGDQGSNVDEVMKAHVERLRAKIESFEDGLEREGQATNTKLKQMKEIIDNQTDNRLNELKRLLEKQLNDQKMTEQENLRIMIHDKLEESQRQQDREWDEKLQSAVSNTLSKANSEMQTYVNVSIKNNSDKLYERIVEDQNALNLKFNQIISETTQNLLNDWNAKYDQLNNNLGALRRYVNEEIQARLGNIQTGSNMDDVNRAIENIRKNWQTIIDKHDADISGLQAANKSMENEFDNMINIKVSNATRNINKSMNDKIREAVEAYQNQTKQVIEDLRSRISEYDMTIHNLKLQFEQTNGEVKHLEASLAQQIEWATEFRNKFKQEEARNQQNIDQLNDEIRSLSDRIVQLANRPTGNNGDPLLADSLKSAINALQKSDMDQADEIRQLKDRFGPELDTKLSLVLRYRDEFLKRIEDVEADHEALKKSIDERLSTSEQMLKNGINQQNEKVKQLAAQVQKLQQDVQMQVDRALRDLESKTLKLQQEIGDLHDQIRELTQQLKLMKENIQTMLNNEFEKINQNFIQSGRTLDAKEQRLQAEIDKLKAELEAYRARMDELARLAGQRRDGASEEELERLKRQVAQHYEVLQRANQEVNNIKISIARVLEIEPQLRSLLQRVEKLEKLWIYFQEFINEQSVDKVKLLRSFTDNTKQHKMEALEWMARYLKFIPKQNVVMAAKDFKTEFMTSTQTEKRAELQKMTPHYAEGIETILVNLRDAKNKLEVNKLNIQQYDELNYLNCILLEGIVLNDQSNSLLVQMQGISDLCRIMQEQPMPSEVENEEFQYTPKFINQAFKPAIFCLMQSLRSEQSVAEFMANSDWIERMLQIAEEFSEEETVVAVIRAIRLTFRYDHSYEKICQKYPSMGEFLCQTIVEYQNSRQVVKESLLALEILLRTPHYIRLINSGRQGSILALKNQAQHADQAPVIDRIISKLKQRG